MESMLKRIRINSVISALISVLIGIVFVLFSQLMADIITQIIGVVLLIGGVLFVIAYIARKDKTALDLSGMMLGIILGIVGVMILRNPEGLEKLLTLILGLVLLVSGIQSLLDAIQLMRWTVGRFRFFGLAFALITIILALVMIIRQDVFSALFIKLFGFFFIYDGITSLLLTWRISLISRDVRRGLRELQAIDVEAVSVEEKKQPPQSVDK